ncbi:efflux RND transporter periplasmic adaptor subunit [Shimia thalassica]|nr:efflux RND transporter periplasmic adaptor subunit [Shimia thalassica]
MRVLTMGAFIAILVGGLAFVSPNNAAAQNETRVAKGVVTAARTWEVSSAIDGRISAIHFSEGMYVQEGTLLVEIDDTQSQLELALARAELKRAEAVLAQSLEDLQRHEELIKRNAVSEAVYSDVKFAHEMAVLGLEAEKLELGIAEKRQSFHSIHAGLSGMISAPKVHSGTNFSVALSGAIASIVQLDPIHVRMKVALDTALARLQAGNYSLEDVRNLKFELSLPDGATFEHLGKPVAVGYELNPETGEGSVLIEFANPSGVLRPGLPVSLKIAGN